MKKLFRLSAESRRLIRIYSDYAVFAPFERAQTTFLDLITNPQRNEMAAAVNRYSLESLRMLRVPPHPRPALGKTCRGFSHPFETEMRDRFVRINGGKWRRTRVRRRAAFASHNVGGR